LKKFDYIFDLINIKDMGVGKPRGILAGRKLKTKRRL
jgi:hypothetical protein